MRACLLGSIRGESVRCACGAPSDQCDLFQSVAESRGLSTDLCYLRTADDGCWAPPNHVSESRHQTDRVRGDATTAFAVGRAFFLVASVGPTHRAPREPERPRDRPDDAPAQVLNKAIGSVRRDHSLNPHQPCGKRIRTAAVCSRLWRFSANGNANCIWSDIC